MFENYFRYLYKHVALESKKEFMGLLDGKAESLLDLGCWDGKNTITYGKRISAKKLYGIELEKSKATLASKKGILVKISDLNNPFPFNDQSMDVVVANHVIEHLTQTELFISEIQRVLKKGGYTIIATPNLSSWHNIFALILGMQPFSGPHVRISDHDINVASKMDKDKAKNFFKNTIQGKDYLRHLVIMTYKELIKNLKRGGFVIEMSYGLGYYPFPPPLSQFLANIDKRHSHYLIIKARKK